MGQYKRVILLDIDETLLTPDYQLTVSIERFRHLVRSVQSDGTYVGLNSDTPLFPLRSWAHRLDLKGPLIGEKGQVLSLSHEDPPQLLGRMTDFFQNLRRQLILRAQEAFPRTFVGLGDVTEFIRQGGRIYGEDQHAVLINSYRQCSFSGYALDLHNGGRLVNSGAIYNHFCNLVLSLARGEQERLEEADRNDRYGILILHEKGASKNRGFKRLIERIGTDVEYYMIGDSLSDRIKLEMPVKLCAVGNASPEFKKIVRESGGVVSQKPFTDGVVEILSNLQKPSYRSVAY